MRKSHRYISGDFRSSIVFTVILFSIFLLECNEIKIDAHIVVVYFQIVKLNEEKLMYDVKIDTQYHSCQVDLRNYNDHFLWEICLIFKGSRVVTFQITLMFQTT